MFFKKNKVIITEKKQDELQHFLCNINDEKIDLLFFYFNTIPQYSGVYKCIEWGIIDMDNLNEYNSKYLKSLNFLYMFLGVL